MYRVCVCEKCSRFFTAQGLINIEDDESQLHCMLLLLLKVLMTQEASWLYDKSYILYDSRKVEDELAREGTVLDTATCVSTSPKPLPCEDL